MGLFSRRRGLRASPPNKRIDLVSVGSSLIAALLFAGFQTKYEWLLDRVDREIATPLRIVCALSVGAAVFVLFEFANYWRTSRSIRRTLRHYLRLMKDVPPLAAITFLNLIILGIALFVVVSAVRTQPQIRSRAVVIFSATGLVVGLSIWLFGSTWYRRWLSDRSKDVCEVLGSGAGILKTATFEDKDHQIADTLHNLEQCHFVLIWCINSAKILGCQNYDAIGTIQNLLAQNPEAAIRVLLQCPFCEDVIERSLELSLPYDETYVTAAIETVSNCLAAGEERVTVALRHGRPYLRCTLWGRLAEKCPLDVFDLADVPLHSDDHDIPEVRFLRFLESGGFMVQEYHPGLDGFASPLFRGFSCVHGGIWNALRIKFVEEFTRGIRWGRPLEETDEGTIRHLAIDLGMKRRRALKLPRNAIAAFIREDCRWRNFIGDIDRRVSEKTAAMRREGRPP